MIRFLVYFFLITNITLLCNSDKLPNIILIVSDDHGTNDLGCYGNDKIKTPNLDKLASEGIKFTNAYTSTASCSPSRSTILSGLYNHANGMLGLEHHFHNFSSYEHVKSLPVLLESLAGYRTARIGKYHLRPEAVYKFQYALPGDSRNSVEMANNCRNFIEKNSDDPFFLYFCSTDPHRGNGKDLNNIYKPDRFGNKDEGYEGVEKIIFDADDVLVPPYLPDTPECRAELAQYYQSVARLDQGVGVLINNLKNSGKWDNTIIIYISDNGIAFPGAKTNIYQAGINIPCIIKYPYAEEVNIERKEFINLVDLTPTLLDIAGVLEDANQILSNNYEQNKDRWDNTVNEGFQGKSFKSILDGNPNGNWNEIFASHTFHEITMYYPMRAVIVDDFKLIWNIASSLKYPKAQDLWESATWQSTLSKNHSYYAGRKIEDYISRPEFELYNIKNDPNEFNNLVNNLEYNEKLEFLKARMKEFQESTNDPWIVKWGRE